jgi:long-chain fatty acid transport protein
MMWAPTDKVSIGLTATRTFILNSDVLVQSTASDDTATFPVRIHDEYNDKRDYPYQFSAGIALFPTSSLLISGDVTYSTAYDYTFINNLNKREAVINGAIGAEYYINKNWAMRGGLFTDFANTPKIVNDTSNQYENVDLFGGSLSLSHFTKNTSITAGGNYKYGTGKAKVAGGANGIQDVTADNWSIFISSAYSY